MTFFYPVVLACLMGSSPCAYLYNNTPTFKSEPACHAALPVLQQELSKRMHEDEKLPPGRYLGAAWCQPYPVDPDDGVPLPPGASPNDQEL